MDNNDIYTGLVKDTPDLVETIPSLGRLKKHCPRYIRKAEKNQVLARSFARSEMMPRVLDIDTRANTDPEYVDWELLKRANREKLTLAFVPQRMGGLGCSALGALALAEELTSVCLASAANILFNNFGLLGAMVKCQTGTLLKIMHMMVDASRREEPMFWAWAITEPGAGTDAEEERAMKTMRPSTHAKKAPGGYILNGTKCFITNGSLASYIVATIPFDRSNPLESMATFLVPANTKGFSVGKVERKCGQKASQTAEIIFDDVFVPSENLWEEPGHGLRHTREMLSTTRGFVGGAAMGVIRGAIQKCIQFASQKRVGEHTLIEEDWVQIAIADMIKDFKVLKAACYNFAIAVDTFHVMKVMDSAPVRVALRLIPGYALLSSGVRALADTELINNAGASFKKKLITDDVVENFVKEGSSVKVAATDMLMKISSRILDIVGLEGMSYKYGIEKIFRDAKVTQIYEGSNQVNRIDIFHNEVGV